MMKRVFYPLIPFLTWCAVFSPDIWAQCCGHWQRPLSGMAVEDPPCMEFACYVGNNGANRLIETNGCVPDIVFVKRKLDGTNAAGVWHSRSMAADVSYLMAPGFTPSFSDTIRDLSMSPAGFTVGANVETNQTGADYCYYAFQARDGYLEYGSRIGTGVDNFPYSTTSAPAIFMLYGTTVDNRQGLRFRSPELDTAGDPRTLNMDASALFDLTLDDMQDLKSVALGDLYNGVELGAIFGNSNGLQYYWMSWVERPDLPGRWLYHGVTTGTGATADGSEFNINSGCLTQTVFFMSSADTGGVPVSAGYPMARHFRHHAVEPPTVAYSQRANGNDLETEPPSGTDGGVRRMETGSVTLANGTGAPTVDNNIAGTKYYYWGLCE